MNNTNDELKEVSQMLFPSPLRYPGGKRKLSSYVETIVMENGIQGGTYIEPFAGGANIALDLLFKNLVSKIVINDLDRSIYAFWYSVLHETEALCRLIVNTPVNMESWNQQKDIQSLKDYATLLELGFSTFYLNRTNRSGIIRGGVIGGKGQTGDWKMDARFNKADLVQRIEKIAKHNEQIELYNLDAIELINHIYERIDNRTLVYFDPPYYNQGAALYSNFYTHKDHANLAQFILNLNCKWMLTYDYTDEVIELYEDAQRHTLSLSYTAQEKVRGSEMIAFSRGLTAPTGKYASISIA